MGSRTKMLGIMSGSSLDGLDLCLVDFWEEQAEWKFSIARAETIDLSTELKEQLRNSPGLNHFELDQHDKAYGVWIGDQVKDFLKEDSVEGVSVHGHTVFHDPARKVSLQIGNGSLIANRCGFKVIDTFRIMDIVKGGQGAPLVPVGEHYLFSGYQGLVNLGGISNLTIQKNGGSRAWDICPFNQVFNHFSRKLGRDYDEGGQFARRGVVMKDQLSKWESLEYFSMLHPKSLSNQWGLEHIINEAEGAPEDIMHTYAAFASRLIAESIETNIDVGSKVLFTGGGALNEYLMGLIAAQLEGKIEVVVPDKVLVGFKEALIFAFLGLLKLQGKPNVFASVTGASEDSCAGRIHHPIGSKSAST